MTSGAVGGRRSVRAWVVYDLANTIFALGVLGLYFPDWITSLGHSDSLLAFIEAIAGAIVIFVAPWAGARSDARGKKVPTLIFTTVVAVLATSLLGIDVTSSALLLVAALIAFNIGGVVYDALLSEVSTEANRGRISGWGVGIGYIGSYIGLLIGIVTLDVLDLGYPATFRGLALGFLLFSLPAFFYITERHRQPTTPPGITELPGRLIASWRKASTYPGVVRFLVSRFLYTDAINTLIGGFLTIFVIQELGLDRRFVTALLGVAITTAVFGGIFGGRFVESYGPNRVLRVVLFVWMVAIASGIAAAATGQTWIAWAIGPLGGFALGATWAADRVVMVRISPPRHLGEFYGLYATVGRFATILGPLTWALIVDGLGWGRQAAMGALVIFILAGWALLGGVDDSVREWPSADRIPGPTDRDELPR
ncbi:MAG TPA: MFS transporter [Acidimicrobiia bacterium]